MDILTLGKMNQMAKDVDQTLEFLANTTFETLRDVCTKQGEIEATQTGQVQCLEDTTQAGVDALAAAGGGSMGMNEFMLYNTNHWSVTNGGCCLHWTVPENVKTIKFEVLGGGGPGGSSGGDHEVTVGGQGGGYASKTIYAEQGHFVPGSSAYTLCAAGTSQCSCCCQCCMSRRQGCTSYATGPGLSNFCAVGGLGGSTPWDKMSNCYDCHMGHIQCCASTYDSSWSTQSIHTQFYGADYGFTGTTGSYTRGYNCCNEVRGYSGGPTGPFAVSGTGSGGHACTQCSGCRGGHSAFPGGGGQGHATASGSGCWGGFGAGGLVRVTYA